MPVLRPGVAGIPPYEAGRPIEEVARIVGFDPDDVIKLASNESPLPPFPEVITAIREAAAGVNRYPDNDWYELRRALAAHLGVTPEQLMFGGGSSELIRVIAQAVGGPGTSTIYPWPSFVVYRMASVLAGSEGIEVALDARHRIDPEAIVGAVRADTTLLFLCNPNNPTGTYLSAEALSTVTDRVPEQVLVVIDEAYFEYATAPDYESLMAEALARPNVVITRTFSKVYGLAALRVGYAVGQAETLLALRRAQAPFTVSSLAQVAAREALGYPERVEERVRLNEQERARIEKELLARGVEHVPSQANFVYLRPGDESLDAFGRLLRVGVIVREMSRGWIRVTVGSPDENDRFLAALQSLI
ncbi:MAG TPA: histidinol-phosphate transaminase [Acidimicrobiia bacterium]|nr:histidinol-phosphate transaminase [Acidimicrobiia bacterium]